MQALRSRLRAALATLPRRPRSARAATALLALLALARSAPADGKAFSTVIAEIGTTEQRALLFHRDGTERLVIETALDGAAGAMAWVIPVPAPPTRLEPADRGMLNTAASYTPVLVDVSGGEHAPLALAALAAAGIVTLTRLFGGRSRLMGRLWPLALLPFALLVLSPKAASFAAGAALPGPAAARVGAYDTVTATASSGDALRALLERQGFLVAPAARAALDAYAREGWTFVAARLAEPGARPHPLLLEFPSRAPVYPMRLTGEATLDLFVFGDAGASCAGLETIARTRLAEPGRPAHPARRNPPGEAAFAHAPLRAFAPGARWLTRLRGRAGPDDLRPVAAPGEPLVRRIPTERAARGAAAERFGLATTAALLLLAIARALVPAARGRRLQPYEALLLWWLAILTGLIVGLKPYLTVPRVAEPAAEAAYEAWRAHAEIAETIGEGDPASAREKAARYWEGRANPSSGGPVVEEESPGNYRIEEREGRAVYRWYDATGAAWPRPPDPPR